MVGDAIQVPQRGPWEEVLGGREQPVLMVTEELHQLGADACYGYFQIEIIILEKGLGG